MSNDPETAEPVARPYKPYQFTVRTFFAAAIWLSLLFAAIKTLDEVPLATAVLALVWIAFVELYRRFRATRAMVALCGGPVLLLVIWWVVLMEVESPWKKGVLPPASWFFSYAFGWGIALSVVVVIERGIDRWRLRRARRRWESDATGRSRKPPARWSGRFRSAAVLFGVHTALALGALVFALSWDGRSTGIGFFFAFTVLLAADLPVVPVYILMGLQPEPDMTNVALTSLVLGGVLYAIAGVIVADVAAIFRREAPVERPQLLPTPDRHAADREPPP
jgi:hypothetical protein